jgi:hypothetical protein
LAQAGAGVIDAGNNGSKGGEEIQRDGQADIEFRDMLDTYARLFQ